MLVNVGNVGVASVLYLILHIPPAVDLVPFDDDVIDGLDVRVGEYEPTIEVV